MLDKNGRGKTVMNFGRVISYGYCEDKELNARFRVTALDFIESSQMWNGISGTMSSPT